MKTHHRLLVNSIFGLNCLTPSEKTISLSKGTLNVSFAAALGFGLSKYQFLLPKISELGNRISLKSPSKFSKVLAFFDTQYIRGVLGVRLC